MDLARCVDALERRANYPYQWNFVRNLKARMRRKAAAFPGDYSLEPLRRVWTVRGFDEAYTAPHHGFRDAADYYHRASALRVVDRIRVPTLILTAEDDPFVPAEPFRDPAVTGNPHITSSSRRTAATAPIVERADRRLRRLLGRARDRQVSRHARCSAISRPERCHRAASAELRPLPCLFVLEVDEDVAAAGRPLAG